MRALASLLIQMRPQRQLRSYFQNPPQFHFSSQPKWGHIALCAKKKVQKETPQQIPLSPARRMTNCYVFIVFLKHESTFCKFKTKSHDFAMQQVLPRSHSTKWSSRNYLETRLSRRTAFLARYSLSMSGIFPWLINDRTVVLSLGFCFANHQQCC